MGLESIKKILYKIFIAFTIFISISFGTVSYAAEDGTSNKEKIRFGKVFQLFINDPDIDSTGADANKQTCSYLADNLSKKNALKGFGNVLYFIIYYIVVTGGLISFMFYKVVDIYSDIKNGEIVKNGEVTKVEKDKMSSLLDSVLKHSGSMLAMIIFFIVITILIKSLTLTC